MKIGQALKMALKSLSTKKGRSFLTMLGIIIGIAAVIALVTYAQGQNAAVKALYDSQGSNVLNVYAYSYSGGSGADDVGQMLYDYCLGLDDVVGVTPNGNVWRDLTVSYGAKTLARQDRYGMGSVAIIGGGIAVDGGVGGQDDHYPTFALGNDKYGLCNNYQIAKGRELSYLEIENMAQVCVLGADTAEYLFSLADPIGKNININGMPFRVVGVYQSKAAGVDVGDGEEGHWVTESLRGQDKLILLPSTMTRYFNNNEPIDQYMVKVKSQSAVNDVVTKLNGYLSGIIDTNNGFFGVNNPNEWSAELDDADAMQALFLGIIAAISLLVAGIGIMNIMLVTVTERTREIGIRKAIGAERKSIIVQFLIEAAMICGIGGLLGIAVGYVAAAVLTKIFFGLVIMPEAGITVLAFGISVVLGILFGLYPALKASALQPVEALRAD